MKGSNGTASRSKIPELFSLDPHQPRAEIVRATGERAVREESRLSCAWKHSTMPSDRLAQLIARVREMAAQEVRKSASVAKLLGRASE